MQVKVTSEVTVKFTLVERIREGSTYHLTDVGSYDSPGDALSACQEANESAMTPQGSMYFIRMEKEY